LPENIRGFAQADYHRYMKGELTAPSYAELYEASVESLKNEPIPLTPEQKQAQKRSKLKSRQYLQPSI